MSDQVQAKSWRTIMCGESNAMRALVFISRVEGDVVFYRKPNPWAGQPDPKRSRAGGYGEGAGGGFDARGGWCKGLKKANLRDVVEQLPDERKVRALVMAIGSPEIGTGAA